MLLILGFSGPANPTTAPGAAASPTAIPDTPEPQTGVGEICVLLFIDANGDARIDEGEAALAQGQVSVADVSGDEVGERTTDDNLEGFCFTEIENGEYNVSAAIPPDFNPTTSMNVPVRVNPGDIKFVQFGAQPSAVLAEQTPESGGDRSSLLGLLGVVLLLAAGALGYYASRYGREARRTLR
jgi:hypothetical protein